MELRLYTAILNRRKWVILVTAVVTLAVVARAQPDDADLLCVGRGTGSQRTAQRSPTAI